MSWISWARSWVGSWLGSGDSPSPEQTHGHGSSIPHFKRTPLMKRKRMMRALLLAASR